jgi:hypothetical protein
MASNWSSKASSRSRAIQANAENAQRPGLPDLTFLQLLFGYRSLDELRAHYADCYAIAGRCIVLATLFPKKPSLVARDYSVALGVRAGYLVRHFDIRLPCI